MELLTQIYDEAIRWYNLPFSVLFGLVLIYWAFQLIGGLFGLVFDFDFDFDGDGDIDPSEAGLMGRFSYALSDGEAPFMWALSVFITLMWGMMMLLNHFFNPISVWGVGIAIMAGSMAIALYITRMFMRFCARVFRKLFGVTSQKETFIGAVGVVITAEVTDKYGQVELDHHGVPCRFNVVLENEAEVLVKGDYAKITSKNPNGKTYLVTKTNEEPHLVELEAAK
ncbi:OB-fold-containig protein [Cerasicoccus maritimus]|uniref:OB-fold-containig protein n=1 Tax=Cerasicoccus maritimus TaxID=490089 RepID=UPI002852D470|nr:OB-fold-containig protein [Cerasicoccus maritimus]